MKKIANFILLLCICSVGMVFAKEQLIGGKTYKTGIIYFSPPFLAQNYKTCIYGTKENGHLTEDQQIGCEESYNPFPEDRDQTIDPKLAKIITQHWGNNGFFDNSSSYIYQLDEKNKKRSVFLWPDSPNWMTPADDNRYFSRDFSIRLSVLNHSTGVIQSVPVILYKNNKKRTAVFAEYIKDFDLVTVKNGSLLVKVYSYKNKKRVLSEQYIINQSGALSRYR